MIRRLLFLAPTAPSPGGGGGSARMFHMLAFLERRWEVDLVAPVGEPGREGVKDRTGGGGTEHLVPVPARRGWQRAARLGPYERMPELARAVSRRIAERSYDAIQVEKPAMLPHLPRGLRVPIVLDTWAFGLIGAFRALRYERGLRARLRNLVRLARFAAFDAFCWPALHSVLVVSDEDRLRCLRRRPDQRVLVVPNGVDCDAFRPAGFPPKDRRLVFTGDMSFAPNVDAALTLAAEIFPRVQRSHPDAELYLVGRDPDPRLERLCQPGVFLTGEVEDMLPHLNAASVYVAPLRTGAGTRTKLLEAMAAGLPIVTTPVGIEGIEARHREEVLVSETLDGFVREVIDLLARPDERRRIGSAARTRAETIYHWPRCLAPLERLYAEMPSLTPPA